MGNAPLDSWLAAGVAAAALAVYLATLAPGLTLEHYGADGGDLIAAAATLGVPHPTGYPTYTLLAWLFGHLPLGTAAYRVNLLSALCAACTAGLLFRTARLVLPVGKYARVLGVAAALTLAFSSLLWSQAVIAEVYALLTLQAAALLWLLLRWRQGGGDAYLWLAAFTLGLGLGNHLTLLFVAPPALVLLWPHRQRWFRTRTVVPALVLFLAGLSVYAYLPLAASYHPSVNWGNPRTWNGFTWVVTGTAYRPLVFGLEPKAILPRLSAWAALLGDQFGWWGLGLALAGGWASWQHDRPLALFGLGWILLTSLYAFFYNTADSLVYLLPVMPILTLWWVLGAQYLLEQVSHLRLGGRVRLALAAAIVTILPIASLALHWQHADLSSDIAVETSTSQVLAAIAPEGLIIVQDDSHTFPMWYALYAQKQRPDVAVVNAPLLAYDWYRENVRHLYPRLVVPELTSPNITSDELIRNLVARNLSERPIYATDPSDVWFTWFDLIQEADTPLYRISLKTKWESSG